jgi:hypothetical protein
MARVLSVFQKNITQNNVYQNEKWGLYPFQTNVFQGIQKNKYTFQENIFQDNIFGQVVDIPAVFDIQPMIIKILNESVNTSEAMNRLGTHLVQTQFKCPILLHD